MVLTETLQNMKVYGSFLQARKFAKWILITFGFLFYFSYVIGKLITIWMMGWESWESAKNLFKIARKYFTTPEMLRLQDWLQCRFQQSRCTVESTAQFPRGSCSRSPFRNSISSVSTFNDVFSSRILTQKSQKIKSFAQSFSSYSGVCRLWETDRVLQRPALSSSTNRELSNKR